MSEMFFQENDLNGFTRAFSFCKQWSEKHQAELGVAEMGLGAAILSWGIINNHIMVGQDVLASKLGDIGGLAGLGIGAVSMSVIAQSYLSGLFVGGIATVAGTVCIPAAVLVGGGALVLGAFGYVAADKIGELINPHMGFNDLLQNASVIAIGCGLMIDGARRIIKDKRILNLVSNFDIKAKVIHWAENGTEIIASKWEEFQLIIDEFLKDPSKYVFAGSTISSATGGIIGAGIGGSLATGSVTLLGSHGLGAAALSLGLVSAPVWPIVACGAVGMVFTVTALKGWQKYNAQKMKKANQQIFK